MIKKTYFLVNAAVSYEFLKKVVTLLVIFFLLGVTFPVNVVNYVKKICILKKVCG